MKKILLFVFALCASTAFAQYHYLDIQCANSNPGGLMTSLEEPGSVDGTWTLLADSAATPSWSSNGTIPWNFQFNGSTQTTYKVSTTGVLTFTVSAVAVPGATPATLPNAVIPDNSVCVWGMNGVGANDKIVSKTLGATPNRQHWVWFNSYSFTTGTNYAYWAIVFEETTNNIYIVDQRVYPTTGLALSIGLQINSGLAYQVSGSPAINSHTTQGGSLDTPADNSYYAFTTANLNHFDFKNNSMPLFASSPYQNISGAPFTFSGTMANLGDSTITSLVLNYSINGAAPVSSSAITCNVAGGACYSYSCPTPWTPAGVGVYKIKVWASSLNGHVDVDHSNDTVTSTVFLYNATPALHKVVFEEATGCWCGWCPRGAVFMDSMYVVHPTKTVLIAVHDNDPMAVSAYDAGVSALVGGYPTILVDRKFQNDPSGIFTEYQSHIGDFGLADITLTKDFNATTRVCSVTVAVKPAVNTDGTWDYRLACVFTEDAVHNTSSTYDQHNYYSGGASGTLIGAGHNWSTEANVIPAANMYFDFVARNLDGGMTGAAGSLPTTMTAGSTYNHTFTYTIPADQNENKMKANVMLIDNTNGMILNGENIEVIPSKVSDPVHGIYEARVFPNPASEKLSFMINLPASEEATLTVTDMIGNVVAARNLGTVGAGESMFPVDIHNLAAGTYMVTFKTSNGSVTKKFVK